MLDMQVTMELLFDQLGLDSNEQAINDFIGSHQLDQNTPMHKAEFWTKSQHDFIISHWKKDDEWAMMIDELNALLHHYDGVHQ